MCFVKKKELQELRDRVTKLEAMLQAMKDFDPRYIPTEDEPICCRPKPSPGGKGRRCCDSDSLDADHRKQRGRSDWDK